MNYSGGKGGVFQKIINLIPPHDVYIETHLGGGAVMRNKRSAKHNFGIDIDPKVIAMWQNVEPNDFDIIQKDAIRFLKDYSFTGKEFVYCDPPYIRETRKRKKPMYKYEYTRANHEELLKLIKTLPCMVMISGYESNLYKASLKEWHTHVYTASCYHGIGIEWLWMNYPPPVVLHDYRYLGDTFKKREHIKLKRKRWMKKFEAMPVLERQAFLTALDTFKEKGNRLDN